METPWPLQGPLASRSVGLGGPQLTSLLPQEVLGAEARPWELQGEGAAVVTQGGWQEGGRRTAKWRVSSVAPETQHAAQVPAIHVV